MILSISNYIKNEKLGKITLKSRNKIQSRELLNFFKKEKIDNIEIVHDVNIYDLVVQSKAIVSLNSLATIESMLSNVPIIIPDWIIKDKNNKMFDSNDETCFKSLEFSENLENLLKNIGKYLKDENTNVSEEILHLRKKFISKFWDYEPNITSCKKVQNVIDSLVRN